MIVAANRLWFFRAVLTVCGLVAGFAAAGESSLPRGDEVPWGSPKGGLEFTRYAFPPTPLENIEAAARAMHKYATYWCDS